MYTIPYIKIQSLAPRITRAPGAPSRDADAMADADAIECAICLTAPAPEDVALASACLHGFCASCLVRWASFTAPGASTKCPCCARALRTVLLRRGLDGAVDAGGYLREESLCLLARARWTEDGTWSGDERDGRGESDDDAYEDAAEAILDRSGRRRVVLGNRRFGRGGFVANGGGRTYATPAARGKASRGKTRVDVEGKERGGTSRGGSGSSSPSMESPGSKGEDDASTPRRRGKKSAKRAESMAKKAEKEKERAASRLRKREEEAMAAAARRAAAAAAKELESLALGGTA